MFKGKGYVITGFKRYFAYKTQVLARLLTSPIEIVIMLLVWSSIFNYSGLEVIGGFSFREMVNYYIIIYLAGLLINDSSDFRLGENIYHGSLVIRLLLPLQIYRLYFNDSLGEKMGSLITQAIPFVIFSVLFLGFASSGIINLLLSLVSFFLAYVIFFFFNMFFGLIAFKLRAYRYISRIKNLFVNLASGKLLPLTMFPAFVMLLPFRFIYYEPANIFLGKYSMIVSLLTLLIQFVWIVLLYALFRIGWFKALKDFEGVGT